jgi:hypothetical protein
MSDRRRTSYRGDSNRNRTYSSNQNKNRRQTFIDGNVVRVPEEVPVRRPKQRKPVRKPVSRNARKNRENALRMNLGYVIFLAAAASILVFCCAKYIRLQADITGRARNIATLENQLEMSKASNDDTYNKLISSVDLEHIRSVAIEELGMIYATEDQVILYTSHDSDYVRQYKNVPVTKE